MARAGEMSTSIAADRTKADIRACFRMWGVNRDDIEILRYQAADGKNGARLEFYVNGSRQILTCERWWDYQTNLRALYLALDAVRKASQRGILEQFAQAALAMLPAPARKKPAHEVLRVLPDAPLEVAEAAYRALAKDAHPDTGGSDERMKELNTALEAFKAKDAIRKGGEGGAR